jgi:hypothetical protein
MLVLRLFVLNLRVAACMFDVEFCMLRRVVVHSPNYSYRNSSNYGFLSVFQAVFGFLSLPLSDGICRLVYAMLWRRGVLACDSSRVCVVRCPM